MYKCFLALSVVLFHLSGFSQSSFKYQSLDAAQPIQFSGRQIIFKGDTMQLGPKAFFIDGNLPDSIVQQYPFVFNNVQDAAKQLTNGSETQPMVLYLAPWVYWIDNPDDTTVRVPKPGSSTPYGMEISCEWLHFRGLNNNAGNVILACNRGQTIGAKGNFTMFKFSGNGTGSENITFGNYCSVDLAFPLKSSLGRAKRASAIVQAQLIHCNGDKVLARNTRFISRLNLCPFVGAQRVLFDRCHFESTDDALCGTGLYLNSSFDFYSSKPFYATRGTGAILLNCEVRSLIGGQQYFTKAGGQLAVVDSRFTGDAATYWGWQDVVPTDTKNYQAYISLNKKPLLIGTKDAASTINMEEKKLLDAYRFIHAGKIVYNSYNLLRGDDDWDPMGIQPLVRAAEQSAQKSYNGIPVQLIVGATGTTVETNKNTVTLTARLFRFGNYAAKPENITWTVADKDKSILKLEASIDGQSCRLVPVNKADNGRMVVVTASTKSGLQGAFQVRVLPQILAAPLVKGKPTLRISADGRVQLSYLLNSQYPDASDIKWYRSKDSAGKDAIEVAVSGMGKPLKTYELSAGDIGYWLMAVVAPKTVRSYMGTPIRVLLQKAITTKAVKANRLTLQTDFSHQSLRNQPLILPGFFTFKPIFMNEPNPGNNIDSTKNAWYFGEGSEGAAGMTGLLQGRHARMFYTPTGTSFGDMQLSLSVSPFKSAGQGFSVAHLYMDILIKFDATTMSGYALRLIRTTKYGNAVDCLLMKYTNGQAEPVTEPVTTSAYRTPCNITISVTGSTLRATVRSGSPAALAEGAIQKEVELEAPIVPGGYGGIGIEYHGGSPAMINKLMANWVPLPGGEL